MHAVEPSKYSYYPSTDMITRRCGHGFVSNLADFWYLGC
jgi:hypothetical protein